MAASTILRDGEISLNGVRFPIVGRVRRQLVNVYAEKQVIGDVSRDTHPHESVLSLTSWPGGNGLEKTEGTQGVKRSWWSSSAQRHKVLTLPPLEVKTADQGISGTYTTILADFFDGTDTLLYAAFGTSVRTYDSNDSWSSELHPLPATATDALTVRVGSTAYVIFAHTGGYTYFDGTTWTDDTQDTKYLTWNAGALWGIDANGSLWTATTIGTETGKAQLPTRDGSVTDLFVSRAPDGEKAIYAMTNNGFFLYDQGNNRWVVTELTQARHPRAGSGSTNHRDSLFIPSGLGIFNYQTFDNSVAVRSVGPDLDDGLPRAQQGEIKKLHSSNNELLALLDGGTIEVALATVIFSPGVKGTGDTGAAFPGLDAGVTGSGPQKGGSTLLGWDGEHWQTKWEGGLTVAGAAPDDLLVSDAYNQYRAWWTFDQRVYYMDLPTSITNPSEITTQQYAASSTHEYPWFDADDEDATKLALRFVGTARDMNSDETIILRYILDYGTTEVTLGTISANGKFEFKLPTSTEVGVVFRSIRPVLDLARGASNTFDSPKLRSLDLVYRKKLPLKWGFEVTINTRQEYGGLRPLALRQAIITAADSGPLIPFNYKDESQGDAAFNVDILRVAGIEETGVDHGDEATLTLVEV